MLGRIVESFPNLIGIVALNKCAGGAYCGTLTAGDTGSICKTEVERLTDAGVDTAVVCTDYRNVLLVTSGYASTTEDTLVVISYEVGGRVVKLVLGLESAKRC